MKFETSIIDDDCVAVIASPSALKARYATHSFDYTFPTELLAGMNGHELFAWRTGSEGEHKISIEVTDEPRESPNDAERTREFAPSLHEDGLLIVPYSQFTMVCDNHGDFQSRDGLATVAPIQAGNYRVSVARIAECAFHVLLRRVTECAHQPVGEIPGWPD